MNRVLVIAAMSFAVALPLRAQTNQNDFETIVAGKAAPLTIRLGDLNNSWRRMTPSAPDNGVLLQLVRGPYNRSSTYIPDFLYTQGKTVSVAGEPFIVAYRFVQTENPISQNAYDEYSQRMQNTSVPPALSKQTVLQLSLINPRITGRFDNIQTFDIEKEVQRSQKARVDIVNQLSLVQLRQVGSSFVYFTRSTGKLPSLKDAATAQKEVLARVSFYPYLSLCKPTRKNHIALTPRFRKCL